jgi:transcription-repair coupling factor (superfamily II helicase)
MPTIYNNVPHTTARLLLSQSIFRDHIHALVITDDTSEYTNIPTIHALLRGVHIQQIHTLADMVYFVSSGSGYGVVHIDTLRSMHTPAYIAKHCTLDIHRGLDMPMNDILEKFLTLGYVHTEGYVESGMYKKE